MSCSSPSLPHAHSSILAAIVSVSGSPFLQMQAWCHLILLKWVVIRSSSRGLRRGYNTRQLELALLFKLEDVFQPVVICHWMFLRGLERNLRMN